MFLKLYERRIDKYCELLKKQSPRFYEYIELNDQIAAYILDIYYKGLVPEEIAYVTKFNYKDSVELATEIISSISPKLAKSFLHYIETEKILVGCKEDIGLSCTFVKKGNICSQVLYDETIVMPLSLVHEFFHYIHLEKYHTDISSEEYYYFTEIYGCMGDLYSCLYLLRNKKYVEDAKAYLANYFNSFAQYANDFITLKYVLDIYINKKSLSSKCIKEYALENELPIEWLQIINIDSIKKFNNILECAMYIFAFPITFQLVGYLLEETEYKEKFNILFDKINQYKPEDLLSELELDLHLENSDILAQLMSAFYINLEDIYGKEKSKIKKMGEV